MNWRLWLWLGYLGVFVASMALGQSKPSAGDQKRTIRVGIALMENRSGRSVTPTWNETNLRVTCSA